MTLDLILIIILAPILFGAAIWLIDVLFRALLSLISALFSAAGAVVFVVILAWLLSSLQNG
ncbi:MAG: hypothetical protein RMJ55_06845 [Roseiflexaceae bacterium]|nr:hypothetical protein [Roseiflexus sp.]MDW8213254.1 hypothetical protein [Roseiflexaceae bacterium]